MTGGTEVTSLAGEGEEDLVMAAFTFNPGEAFS